MSTAKQLTRFMYPLFESIYLNDRVFRNLPYHEARMKSSIRILFGQESKIELATQLSKISFPVQGLFKTRITYDTEINNVEFVPYTIRPVQSLKLVDGGPICYEHKFADRTNLTKLLTQRGASDDILITKNGLITDSSYANVIFKKGDLWFTPESYLLKGTMRQYLLDNGSITEANITVSNFHQYQSCKLINSMLGMNGIEIAINSIN